MKQALCDDTVRQRESHRPDNLGMRLMIFLTNRISSVIMTDGACVVALNLRKFGYRAARVPIGRDESVPDQQYKLGKIDQNLFSNFDGNLISARQ